MIVGCFNLLFQSRMFFHVSYYFSDSNLPTDLSSYNQKSVFVVVPGIGNRKNLDGLSSSLSAIKQSLDKAQYDFDCIVYVWNKEILNVTRNRLKDLCRAKFNKGMWAQHLERTLPRKATYVAVLLDDVDASKVDIIHTLDLMEKSRFDGASPSYFDNFRAMRRRENCLSHRTDHLNIFLTIMTAKLWDCFQSLIDVKINNLGWGLDLLLSDFCNASLGVIDNATIFHQREKSSYNNRKAYIQLLNYVYNKTGLSNGGDYYKCVIEQRPATHFAECTLYKSGKSQFYNQSANEHFRRVCLDSSAAKMSQYKERV